MTEYEVRDYNELKAKKSKYDEARRLLTDLVSGLRVALIWAWYLFGIGGAASLYYFPIPQTGVQGFALLGWFVFFTLLSVGTYKTKEIEARMKP